MESSDNTIWVGTHQRGIYYFNRRTGEKGHVENNPGQSISVTNNIVNALIEDSDHNIWIANDFFISKKISAFANIDLQKNISEIANGGGTCLLVNQRKFSGIAPDGSLSSFYKLSRRGSFWHLQLLKLLNS